jgi:hypothetical protein
MSTNKEVFTVKIDEKDVELAVIRPTVDIQQRSQMYYNKVFGESLKSGAILKASLKTYMKNQQLWDENKQKEHDGLVKTIDEGEKKLSRGNIKLSEAKKIALDMRLARIKLRTLLSDMTELYPNTAEGQADNARFNYLAAACLVYNTNGERFYKNIEDYLKDSENQIAIIGATKFAELYYGLNNEQELGLPENKFLKKYNFINNNLQLVDKDGNLVDIDGRHIDEFGYYIDEEGSRIDLDGNPLDENGFYKFESSPFLDDDGNPLVVTE